MTAPDIGARFIYRDGSYRVDGWLKVVPNPNPGARPVGPDHRPLVFCAREEAEYVAGAGIGGCIARVGDVEVFGVVDWPSTVLDSAREYAVGLIGQQVF